MFDMPSGNLTVGQIVTGPNNVQFKWDGVKWTSSSNTNMFSISAIVSAVGWYSTNYYAGASADL